MAPPALQRPAHDKFNESPQLRQHGRGNAAALPRGTVENDNSDTISAWVPPTEAGPSRLHGRTTTVQSGTATEALQLMSPTPGLPTPDHEANLDFPRAQHADTDDNHPITLFNGKYLRIPGSKMHEPNGWITIVKNNRILQCPWCPVNATLRDNGPQFFKKPKAFSIHLKLKHLDELRDHGLAGGREHSSGRAALVMRASKPMTDEQRAAYAKGGRGVRSKCYVQCFYLDCC